MSKRKKVAHRASSSGKRRNTAASYAGSSPRLRPRKKPWLYTWGFVIVSAIMVIVLGASVLTFLR